MSKSKELPPEDNKRYSELSTARTTWGTVFRFPVQATSFSLLQVVHTFCEDRRVSYAMDTASSSRRGLQDVRLLHLLTKLLCWATLLFPLHAFKAWPGSMSFLSISQIQNQLPSHSHVLPYHWQFYISTSCIPTASLNKQTTLGEKVSIDKTTQCHILENCYKLQAIESSHLTFELGLNMCEQLTKKRDRKYRTMDLPNTAPSVSHGTWIFVTTIPAIKSSA
jgi:hypothetical protein